MEEKFVQVFVVVVGAGEKALEVANRLIRDSGATSYCDVEKCYPDGIQEPYRAVDAVDALIWVYTPLMQSGSLLGMSDFNYLYADTVMQRAVRTGKPILYYYLDQTNVTVPCPAIMRGVTRRATATGLTEFEVQLRSDLRDLVAGRIPFFNPGSPSVFLSYSHNDRPFVRRLKNDLQLAGARVWTDDGEIQVGESLIEAIRRGIDETDYFCVILSPDSVKSRWVQNELDIAMNHEIDGRKIKVLPLVYRECELPGFLKGKLYADFSADYNGAFSLVLRRLGLTDFGTVSA